MVQAVNIITNLAIHHAVAGVTKVGNVTGSIFLPITEDKGDLNLSRFYLRVLESSCNYKKKT